MLRGLVAMAAVLFSLSSVADYRFSTFTFPGHMKVVAELEKTSGAAVDYLFIIDDSGSMGNHQQNLARNIDFFVHQLTSSGTDFQVGVITTDTTSSTRNGLLLGVPYIVTPRTPDATEAIRRNLLVGTNGSGVEEMFSPLQLALSEPLLSGANRGFLRPDAELSIIVLSDAEDQGEKTADEIYQFLLDTKGKSSLVSVHGILAHSATDPNLCHRDAEIQPPVKIEALISLAHGELFGLCEENVKSSLEKIVKRSLPTVTRVERIPLMVTPAFDTIEVTYGSQIIPAGDIHRGWTFDHFLNEVVLGKKIEWTNQPFITPIEVKFVPLEWTL